MTRRHTPERLTLDAILPHLDKRKMRVRATKDGKHVMARCPAHDDQNASLSLTEKADGTLLWKCFAGCSQEAVRRELERLAGMERETAHPIPPDKGTSLRFTSRRKTQNFTIYTQHTTPTLHHQRHQPQQQHTRAPTMPVP